MFDYYFTDFGIVHPIGHVDFYPNGGSRNPGCDKSRILSFFTDGIKEGLRRLVACDHQRAVDFFLASINTHGCDQLAVQCSSYEDYLAGKCYDCGPNGERCAVMGPEAIRYKKFISQGGTNLTRTMFLQTGQSFPFCCKFYSHIRSIIHHEMIVQMNLTF